MRRYITAFTLLLAPCFAASVEEKTAVEHSIGINNRILARVNGKTISVMDVMKKMEIYLARSYPEAAKNPNARYQFFTANWRQTLSQLIDNELILADADAVQLKVSDAEVRETLHERFGPNISQNLEKLGITYDEAWHMLYSEMAVQRMSWFRVQSKALQRITPFDVKAAYKKYLAENPASDRWKYQVVSIRAPSETIGSIYAQKAYALLTGEKATLEELVAKLKKETDKTITVNVSEPYDLPAKDVSEAHKKVLISLKPGDFSLPTAQVSRTDQTMVHRIFHLQEHSLIKPASFKEKMESLQDELVQKEIDKELPQYLKRLRQRFNVDDKAIETLPSSFQPFVLR